MGLYEKKISPWEQMAHEKPQDLDVPYIETKPDRSGPWLSLNNHIVLRIDVGETPSQPCPTLQKEQ